MLKIFVLEIFLGKVAVLQVPPYNYPKTFVGARKSSHMKSTGISFFCLDIEGGNMFVLRSLLPN